jgi:hypothetical protein
VCNLSGLLRDILFLFRVDGAKIGLYPGFASIELIAIPYFEPNNYPDPKRFWLFDPMAGITNRETQYPYSSFHKAETAMRIYRDVAGFDTSLYYYCGYSRQPSIMPGNPVAPTKLTLFYPELSVYGASAQGRALDGVVSFETGYYDSRQDRHGTDPMIPNSQTRYLIGYQRQLWEDFTIGMQYYGEYMQDYSPYVQNLPPSFPQEKRLHQLATIRLTQFLMHQTMRLSFFCVLRTIGWRLSAQPGGEVQPYGFGLDSARRQHIRRGQALEPVWAIFEGRQRLYSGTV